MKILSISRLDIWPFGTNKGIPSVLASQKGFVDRGHEVHFLCPLKKEDLPRTEERDGVQVYRMRFPFGLSVLWAYHLPTNRLWPRIKGFIVFNLDWLFMQIYGICCGISLAKKVRPDIIYCHSGDAAIPAYILSRLFKAKFILRVYGIEKLLWHWDNVWHRIRKFRDFFYLKMPVDYLVITKDGSGADIIARKIGVKEEKIKSWRNGIDTTVFEPIENAKEQICRELNLDPSTKIILSLSRLIHQYSIDRVITTCAEMFKKNSDAVLIIAGSGSEKENLVKLAEDRGISSRVLFLGTVDHDMVKKLLYASDLYVFLSQYHNCTNTMWEAMSTGACIVTTENEGIKEAITSGEHGILVAPEELDELPKKLESLLNEDDLRRKLSTNVRKRAEEILESWPERINREVDLLEELVRK